MGTYMDFGIYVVVQQEMLNDRHVAKDAKITLYDTGETNVTFTTRTFDLNYDLTRWRCFEALEDAIDFVHGQESTYKMLGSTWSFVDDSNWHAKLLQAQASPVPEP
jgi:hypothetical protein